MDKLEEERLVPERKVLYQFSARGHDMAQAMLGSDSPPPRRDLRLLPLAAVLLSLGVPIEDGARLRDGAGRGLFGRARHRRGVQLPPIRRGAGAAHVGRSRSAIYADRGLGAGDRISSHVLGDRSYDGSDRRGAGRRRLLRDRRLLGGPDHRHDAELPMRSTSRTMRSGFSVPSTFQTPGRRHRQEIWRASATSPSSPATATEPGEAAGAYRPRRRPVRAATGRALLRLTVPRLQGPQLPGHPDLQGRGDGPRGMDPRSPAKLKAHLVGPLLDEEEWDSIEAEARAAVEAARQAAEARGVSIRSGCSTMSSTTARCRRWAGNGPTATAPPTATRSPGPRASG
jgi:2-oxoisovalerate dehydrogenase E1 component